MIESSVIDMGSLLRTKIIFNKGDTYGDIIKRFVNAVQNYPNCVSVFDGYNDDTPSKIYNTLKQIQKVDTISHWSTCSSSSFTCDSKAAFFANRTNKQEFINDKHTCLDVKDIRNNLGDECA